MIINWKPTPSEEVMQCVRTLLTTAPGTVPMSRTLGTPQDVVDSPESAAAAKLAADVIQAVKTFEPRVRVKRVRTTGDQTGRLVATAEVVAP